MSATSVLDTINGLIFLAVFILVPIIGFILSKGRHKHSLSVTNSPHSPAGRGVHRVIRCDTCSGTWDLNGSDYYGTSTLLKGGKIRKPLSNQELAQVLLHFAKSENLLKPNQYDELYKLSKSKPKEVLKILGI